MFIRSIMLICLTHVAFDIALCTFYIKSANEEAVQLLHQRPRHTNEMRKRLGLSVCVSLWVTETENEQNCSSAKSRLLHLNCISLRHRQSTVFKNENLKLFHVRYDLPHVEANAAVYCSSLLFNIIYKSNVEIPCFTFFISQTGCEQIEHFKNWNVNGHSACTLRLWQIQRRNRKMKYVSCRYLFCTQLAGYDMKKKPKKEREWRANGIIKKEDKNSEFESFVLLFVRSTLTNAKSFHFFSAIYQFMANFAVVKTCVCVAIATQCRTHWVTSSFGEEIFFQ